MSKKTDNFISKISPLAVQDMKATGVLASLTIAQAILESGWGESTLAAKANNLFGIKAGSSWTGRVYNINTKEYRGDVAYVTNADFRAYNSWQDSILDHSKLLQGKRYAKVLKATNYKDACQEVYNAGYATSSSYPQQLITLIEQYGLYKFDEPKEQPQDKPKEQPQTTATFEPYMVRIICDSLTIRKEASFNSDPVGYVHRGEAFTIVGEANGLLKLKSGKGWISANNKYVQKI